MTAFLAAVAAVLLLHWWDEEDQGSRWKRKLPAYVNWSSGGEQAAVAAVTGRRTSCRWLPPDEQSINDSIVALKLPNSQLKIKSFNFLQIFIVKFIDFYCWLDERPIESKSGRQRTWSWLKVKPLWSSCKSLVVAAWPSANTSASPRLIPSHRFYNFLIQLNKIENG